MKRLDRAEAIRLALELKDKAELLLDILIPEQLEDGCSHPPSAIVDLSTMEDEGERYRCNRCGAESPTPFHTTPDTPADEEG